MKVGWASPRIVWKNLGDEGAVFAVYAEGVKNQSDQESLSLHFSMSGGAIMIAVLSKLGGSDKQGGCSDGRLWYAVN